VASLSSAWRAGEVRPTFSVEAKPRYLRSLQAIVPPDASRKDAPPAPAMPSLGAAAKSPKPVSERPKPIYATPGQPVYHAFTMIWPLVCRRLEGCPNISAAQLFDELCMQFPGRFHPRHLTRSLEKRVKQWRQDARARGVVIPPRKNRRFSNKPRGPAPVPYSCTAHLTEMHQWLEEHPDRSAKECSDRIPSALSRNLSPQSSTYVAASRTGLAPRSHSAADLQAARAYPGCKLQN
jgi:hypothetical protein